MTAAVPVTVCVAVAVPPRPSLTVTVATAGEVAAVAVLVALAATLAPAIRAARISAVPGALLGITLGIGLFAAASHVRSPVVPPAWWLAAAVLGVLISAAVLASIPAWAGARRPPAGILQAEAV